MFFYGHPYYQPHLLFAFVTALELLLLHMHALSTKNKMQSGGLKVGYRGNNSPNFKTFIEESNQI